VLHGDDESDGHAGKADAEGDKSERHAAVPFNDPHVSSVRSALS
jgi:hypothetical protein